MLAACPTPKLLGALGEYNRSHGVERVPLALSEAWLFGGFDEEPGELLDPCEACRFGLTPWMEGPETVLPLKPGAPVLLVLMDGDPDRPLVLGAVPDPITRLNPA
jgi:hypothetical protein